MANEFKVDYYSGLFLVAIITFPNNQTWAGGNTSAARTNTTAIAQPVALTEAGLSGQYLGSFPSTILVAGRYGVTIYEVATAGVILLTELQAGPAFTGQIDWNGASEVSLSGMITGSPGVFTAPALANAPSGSVYGQAGSTTVTISVYDTDGTTPLLGVSVYISSDIGGTQRTQSLLTDALGQVVFYLNPGTVYVWKYRYDKTFTNPSASVIA